ncbi:Di-copper centre-containing protein [Melanomma pulvis-pyrius CBS 109.77]|uniref:Di-copper centre-containing protein n=1 Tax=Melanomma pulvis-pyrius CBS 109.77 TaxID=1314802 RepID=A0A6A6WR08_9PLEO|nr:Di-copper centre-containing protein [Melanomma pulvis-pyrius CBS 109.77]
MVGVSLERLYALLVSVSLLSVLCAGDAVGDLQTKGRAALDAQLANRAEGTRGDVSATDRKAYIAAVLCFIQKPSKLSATAYPGAKSRYDDFVAVHIKNSLTIHGTGNFLSWHRYFTWAYEQSLRTECGYNGTQPYWDWGRWASSPETSPIFDGSDTSMSGQGIKTSHSSNGLKPAGQGGGCIEKGPFKDMKVNLGPMAAMADTTPPKNPRADGFGYNPRCIKRDISNYLTARDATTAKIASLITGSANIGAFQNNMQSQNGVHSGGHFTISGDPGSDFYVSPGDPAFWLHHGMIDRTWYIWQTQDFANRQQVIAGGTSMMGGGKAQSLEDVIDLDVVNIDGKKWKIKELVSTVDGPFCYVYE